MNFALTDDQIMIRDAAESFLADVSDSAAVRRAMESEPGYDLQVWQRIGAELGWCGVAVDEAYGGLGLGPVALMLIQEQAGRRLLCAPFFTTVCVGATLLSEIATDAARERLLPLIAAGEHRLGMPLYGDAGSWARSATAVQARAVGETWQLQGSIRQVADGATADTLIAFADIEDEGLGLFVFQRDAAGVQTQALTTWDATRRFADVTLNGVAAERIDDSERVESGLARAAALARLYLAAEQLGAAQQCLDMTVEYTATRKQFGRAVGGFQAVKHRCAEMMVKIEALRSAVYGAAALASGDVAPEVLMMECTMARVLAVDALFFCAQEAIQLHGGVGFTWEYDPQLYFKRAQASAHWLGSADRLQAELADALLAE